MHVITHEEWIVTERQPWAPLFRLALRAALNSVADPHEPELGQQTGIAVYDSMSRGQQLYMLLTAGRVLLEGGKMPQVIQADGTLAALFAYMRRLIREEIRSAAAGALTRSAALETSRTMMSAEGVERTDSPSIELSSTNEKRWLELVESLEARIVRNRHFEDFEELVVASFVDRDELLSKRGLPWDYCDWRPIDLEEQDFADVVDEIAQLTEEEPDDELAPEASASACLN